MGKNGTSFVLNEKVEGRDEEIKFVKKIYFNQ